MHLKAFIYMVIHTDKNIVNHKLRSVLDQIDALLLLCIPVLLGGI